MILYLTAIAIGNLALGYMLAGYLGPLRGPRAAADPEAVGSAPPKKQRLKKGSPKVDDAVEEPPAERSHRDGSPTLEKEVAAETPLAVEVASAEVVAEPVAEPLEPVAAATEVEAAPVEEDLLAGINEFRNQLAQMNSADDFDDEASEVAEEVTSAKG